MVTFSTQDGPPPPEEMLYPALTRRARRETKKLGQNIVKQPTMLRELLEAQNIGVVTVPLVHEPVVDLEDTLYVSKIPVTLYTA